MAEKKAKLSNRQQAAIVALIETKTVSEAAKASKVSRRTLARWLAQPEFKNAYEQAQKQIFGQSMLQLQTLTQLAVDTLESILRKKKASDRTKVTAARTVLKTARSAIEIDDLQKRIDKLEGVLNEIS